MFLEVCTRILDQQKEQLLETTKELPHVHIKVGNVTYHAYPHTTFPPSSTNDHWAFLIPPSFPIHLLHESLEISAILEGELLEMHTPFPLAIIGDAQVRLLALEGMLQCYREAGQWFYYCYLIENALPMFALIVPSVSTETMIIKVV